MIFVFLKYPLVTGLLNNKRKRAYDLESDDISVKLINKAVTDGQTLLANANQISVGMNLLGNLLRTRIGTQKGAAEDTPYGNA